MRRADAAAVAIYVASALADEAMTWRYVVELGLFEEANPLNIFVHWRLPLWLWLLADVAALTAIRMLLSIPLTYAKRAGHPGAVRLAESFRRVGLWFFALLRLIPVIHNLFALASTL